MDSPAEQVKLLRVGVAVKISLPVRLRAFFVRVCVYTGVYVCVSLAV